jgi:predicted amidophosphoribosyltransferase
MWLFPNACDVCASKGCSPCASCEPKVLRRHVRSLDGIELPVEVVCEYSDAGKALVRAMKFRGRRNVARWFASQLITMIDLHEVDAVTWIPSSRRGRRRRGFDSGRLLAEEIARCAHLPAVQMLRRVGSSSQGGRDRTERVDGPRLALAWAGRQPAQRCLLVDDVCTTGASLRCGVETLGGRVVALAVAASTPERSVDRC